MVEVAPPLLQNVLGSYDSNPNSMAAYLPTSLNYQLPQAVGIPHRIKLARWYPYGASALELGSNDIVRFNISGNQFWDPYSAYLRFTVSVPDKVLEDSLYNDLPWDGFYPDTFFVGGSPWSITHKVLQLDGCAQSFIQYWLYSEQGSELERLMSADILANILKDFAYGPQARTTRDFEGLGGQVQTNFTNQTFKSTQFPAVFVPDNLDVTLVAAANSVEAGVPAVDSNAATTDLPFSTVTNGHNVTRPAFGVGQTKPTIGNVAPTTQFAIPGYIPTLFFDPRRNYNFAPNTRTQIKASQGLNPQNFDSADADTKASYNPYGGNAALIKQWPDVAHPIQRDSMPQSVAHMMYGCPNMGFETEYGDGYSRRGVTVGTRTDQAQTTEWVNDDTTATRLPLSAVPYPSDETTWENFYKSQTDLSTNYYRNSQQDTTEPMTYINTFGYSNPFPANFGTTTFEPMFSKYVGQKVIWNGVPSVQKVTEFTFYVPLLSGIFGHLMHPTNYKLIPLVAFKELILEIQFNPYALFSSWSSTAYQDRRYTIKDLEIQCQVAEFMDLNVIKATNEALRTGFTLSTQSYYMGPRYPITNNSIPPNLQINLGFDSLRAIFICFLAADYLNYTMFRKQYRLSANLTSLQVKIGTEYYPQLPLRGNGGSNVGKDNNLEFYLETLKCFGLTMGKDQIAVNPHNFAINWRELSVAAKKGIVDINAGRLSTYEAGVHTNFQLGFFYENRILGKAVYGIDLDCLNYDNAILSGVNTNNARPFDVLLGANNTSTGYGYTGDMVAYIFCKYDLILSFANGEVRSLGKS